MSSALAAQQDTTRPKATQKIGWQIITDNGEFSFAMPQGYESFSDGGYTMGTGISVKRHITVTRPINGVFLMVEFYEGNVKDILKELTFRLTKGEEAYQLSKDTVVGEMSEKEYRHNKNGYLSIQQFYLSKKKLYIVRTIAKDEKSAILEGFLNAAQPGGARTVATLPAAIEEILPLKDEEPLKGDPDRGIVILYKPRPAYTPEARAYGVTGEVVLNVLFAANGKITKAEPVSGPKELWKSSTDAAARIRFLPAEKDGKLVSVWKKISYSFSIY